MPSCTENCFSFSTLFGVVLMRSLGVYFSVEPFSILFLLLGTEGISLFHESDFLNFFTVVGHHELAMVFDEVGMLLYFGEWILEHIFNEMPSILYFGGTLRLTVELDLRVNSRC